MSAAVTRIARAATLVLLAWQAVVVQAHFHLADRPATAASAQWSRGDHRPDTPPPCPVCREIAHAGQYVSPGPVMFGAPADAPPWQPVATPPTVQPGSRSHFWRSRAPPLSLHA